MAEDLLKRRELIAAGSRVTGGPPLIQEIGTDALLPCTSSPTTWTAIWAHPSSRRSGSESPHHGIPLRQRADRPSDPRDGGVGRRLRRQLRHPGGNRFDYPVTADLKMVDTVTVTVFDDVFVPWERVFLCGEWRYARPLANTFVEFHRFTAVSYKLPMCELFIGATQLIAEYNGVANVTHVRDKIMELVAWTETTRGLLVTAPHRRDWEAGGARYSLGAPQDAHCGVPRHEMPWGKA